MDLPKSTLPIVERNAPHEVVPPLTPSAIATFSDVISSLHSKTTSPSCPTKRCYVDVPSMGASLPTEILMMIFQCVFESCVSSHDVGNYDSTWMASWLEDDPVSPALFPYSLASVCARWLHILAGTPVYWTRLVITVDMLVTSPIVIQTVLEWVGHRPLEVIVTRHCTPSADPDHGEYARVQMALDLLRPHICHVRSLTFGVKHRYSLPALWRERGYARYLTRLTLISDRAVKDDVVLVPRLPEQGAGEDEPQLEAPILRDVMLSGPFFEDTVMDNPRVVDWFRDVTCLTVCGYTSATGEDLSLYAFLCALESFSSVDTLTLEDMAFIDDLPLWAVTLKPATLHLRRLSSKGCLLSILTRTVSTSVRDAITVVDASLTTGGGRLALEFSSASLAVQDVGAEGGLDRLVGRWTGEQLVLTNCSGCTDTFLARTVVPIGVRSLQLVNCEHVSVQGVVGVVGSREELTTAAHDLQGQGLVELHIGGRGPAIGSGEAGWLAEHVKRFSWDTIAGDGRRYVWDANTREVVVSPVKVRVNVDSGVDVETRL